MIKSTWLFPIRTRIPVSCLPAGQRLATLDIFEQDDIIETNQRKASFLTNIYNPSNRIPRPKIP
jgi:hypothetical protein